VEDSGESITRRLAGEPPAGRVGIPSSSCGEYPMSMGMRVRIVMEWLGLVEPDRSRREPIAVPAWAPYAVAASVAISAGAMALLAMLALGALRS
jgi:hypothetical protein